MQIPIIWEQTVIHFTIELKIMNTYGTVSDEVAKQ